MERLLYSLAPGIDISRQTEIMNSESGRGDDDAEQPSPGSSGASRRFFPSNEMLEALSRDAPRSDVSFLRQEEQAVDAVIDDFADMTFEEGRCVLAHDRGMMGRWGRD
jgi:hypothetical protein